MHTRHIFKINDLVYATGNLTSEFFKAEKTIDNFILRCILQYITEECSEPPNEESKEEIIEEYLSYMYEELMGKYSHFQDEAIFNNYADESYTWYDSLFAKLSNIFIFFTEHYSMLWRNFDLKNSVVQHIAYGYVYFIKE